MTRAIIPYRPGDDPSPKVPGIPSRHEKTPAPKCRCLPRKIRLLALVDHGEVLVRILLDRTGTSGAANHHRLALVGLVLARVGDRGGLGAQLVCLPWADAEPATTATANAANRNCFMVGTFPRDLVPPHENGSTPTLPFYSMRSESRPGTFVEPRAARGWP